MKLDEWNARYRSREQLDDEPSRLLIDAAVNVAPGRALDLACGAGRNAAWLAEHGWDVVAIDGATEAIRLVRSEEHTSELQSQSNLVCRLLLEKKKGYATSTVAHTTHPSQTASCN